MLRLIDEHISNFLLTIINFAIIILVQSFDEPTPTCTSIGSKPFCLSLWNGITFENPIIKFIIPLSKASLDIGIYLPGFLHATVACPRTWIVASVGSTSSVLCRTSLLVFYNNSVPFSVRPKIGNFAPVPSQMTNKIIIDSEEGKEKLKKEKEP